MAKVYEITVWTRGVTMDKEGRDIANAFARALEMEGKFVQAFDNYEDLPDRVLVTTRKYVRISDEEIESLELQTVTQEAVRGSVCGPVRIQIEGFRPIYNEVCFVDMKPDNGAYEPLIGYIVLEQCQAAVDMLGHRLIHVKRMDLK